MTSPRGRGRPRVNPPRRPSWRVVCKFCGQLRRVNHGDGTLASHSPTVPVGRIVGAYCKGSGTSWTVHTPDAELAPDAPPTNTPPAGYVDHFYVTVRRDTRQVGWLLGPYAAYELAAGNVDRARDAAAEIDRFTGFDAFGVTRARNRAGVPARPGVLNDRIGLHSPDTLNQRDT